MANLAASDVTVTLNQRRRVNGRNVFNATLAFGDAAKLYASGGVPLTIANLGCPNVIESLNIYDNGNSSYEWSYDTTNGKLVAKNQPIVLSKVNTPTGNGAGVETSLLSYSLPASTLGVTGDQLQLDACGTYAANGNTKTVILYGATAGTTAMATYAGAENNLMWNLRAIMTLNNQVTRHTWNIVFGKGAADAAGAVVATTYYDTSSSLTSAYVIKITGNGTGASDVVMDSCSVRYVPGTVAPTSVAIAAQSLKCEVVGW